MRTLLVLALSCALCFGQNAQKQVLLADTDAPLTPTDSPGGGTYSSTQSVTLSDPTSALILYTTDGSTPACPGTGTLYTGAISVTVTTTIKAIGCNGVTGGGVLTSVYTITGASAPTYVNSDAPAISFGSPITSNIGTVNTGDIIFYFANGATNGLTFTPTDNCNTGGASDTNVIDAGPTNQGTVAGTAQSGHFIVGLGRANCTVSIAWAGGGSLTIDTLALRGATAVDVKTAIVNQTGTGTGANVISAGALTTTAKDLCVTASTDENVSAGTLTAGTSPQAWTLGAVRSSYPNGNEYFIQSAAGSITGTMGITSNSWTQAAMTCFKP